ncbi:hypothetical protein EPA93_38010 [Ktedonosporobacter rubrisoli]|uniref:Uncharacterized protein n=1 Tax=Ktedonosporobacter rubrisoli TaxID=2509675 RepID=A0A4P6JZW5_KTERU|nr:hypothetical protein [Ktedonosporobacter rubrisoli]QBD81458.1 hypothetical protein EPA93_38010 [Ktedonosporobacter rubrisoli]
MRQPDELKQQTSQTAHDQGPQLDIAELSVTLEPLKSFFNSPAALDELEILGFCLHHLFIRLNTLYHIKLPELAESSQQARVSQLASQSITYRYALWSKLGEIKQLIQHVEPLCYLLKNSLIVLLDLLDARQAARKITRELQINQPYEQYLDYITSQERCEKTVKLLTTQLNDWQAYRRLAFTFAGQLAGSSPSLPQLTHMDAALNDLQESAQIIFGNILLDFQGISVGDDEAVATLLFDLMQKIDHLLQQIDILQQALPPLIKHYAIRKEMN